MAGLSVLRVLSIVVVVVVVVVVVLLLLLLLFFWSLGKKNQARENLVYLYLFLHTHTTYLPKCKQSVDKIEYISLDKSSISRILTVSCFEMYKPVLSIRLVRKPLQRSCVHNTR